MGSIGHHVRRLVVGIIVIGTIWLPLTNAQPTSIGSPSSTRGITISPPLKEVTLGSGLLQANTTVGLTNNSGQALTANLQLVDFQALNEFGGVSLGQVGAPVTKYSLAHWMQLPEGSKLSIQNGQTVNIPVSIENTKDLAPGGHYGAVVVDVSTAGQSGVNAVGLKQELVSLLFVNKTGGDVFGLKLQSLKADSTIHTPNAITAVFTSTGNVHVVPRGYIEVTDPGGKLLAKGIINPESTLVMPGSSRQFVTIMQPVANSHTWGRYKITAYYRYDGQQKITTSSLYYSSGIVNLLPLIGVLTGVIILIILFLRYRKRRPRHALHHPSK